MTKKIKISKRKEFSFCSVGDIVDLNLTIIRKEHSKNNVIGEFLISNKIFATSVEPTVREKGIYVRGFTAIPKGVYEVILKQNSHYKRELPLIMDIPGFPDTYIVDSKASESNEIGITYVKKDGAEQDLVKILKETQGKTTITIK